MPLPTASFVAADTVIALRSYVTFTPAPSGTAVSFSAKMVDYQGDIEVKKRLIPGAGGVLRPDRIVQTSAEESMTFEIEEIKAAHAILGNRLNGLVKGAVTVWITDPDDASGKAKLKTDDFACVVQREGNISFNDDFSKVKLKFTCTKGADITFSVDATA